MTQAAVAAIIPAKDEADRIGATIAAVRQLRQVQWIVVVDDGSRDDTAAVAQAAGAQVVRHPANRGKGPALQTGADYIARHHPGSALLFVDADLAHTATALEVLIAPILDDTADMTIATLPAQHTAGGGRGLVVSLARKGIARSTGWTPVQPLSGMRCLSEAAFARVQPLAAGWGVEVGLTIDALAAGLRVVEVPCDLQHRVTGKDFRAQLHRARQYRDVARALAERRLRSALAR